MIKTCKKCPKCHQFKPIDLFSKDKSRKDGLYPYCKNCLYPINKANSHRYLEKHRVYSRERQRKLRSNPESNILIKEQDRHYKKNHRIELAAGSKNYRKENPEKIKKINAEYYIKNKEKIRAWAHDHPESNREYCHRRRARAKSVLTIKFDFSQLENRLSMFGNKCWICHQEANTIDHVKPIAKGGGHILANIRPACGSCNSQKGAIWPYVLPNHQLIN